ncbi:NAD(P)/FAD-dependent oxidoreductase [Amycolatopsis sp. 195334CR]|uniref:NAD(P)/FAD-dependent oxidoreductase n=1 Tax=Amycolatopsis sp. 195334CR TaxID=2814588 RepID=UPI001A8F5B56|nr:NAD(P)/FAD-dependent oxidoreductase [Amycolatopsis sp. 195334CR]MBN6038421.1 NAD(P)/FAD-dependent oxidoreductase [Amycolatopsis sp. 195334CR]
MVTEIETDYLVIGAGATAMAFVDTLLTESSATVTIVDRYHQPGGHWTIAYPYVRLHQPSAMYGVNSRPLGENRVDRTGWNAGLYELAGAAEICGYFDQVMRQTFLPSGRVSYFPMAEYQGGGRFHLTTSGKEYQVKVRRKIVDTTYQSVTVPAMRAPEFPVAPGIPVVPPNELPAVREPHDRYVVVGAGKTGIDACLWLLEHGVAPADLTWIMPRAPWLIDRATVQPLPLRQAEDIAKEYGAKHEAIMGAESVPDLFTRLEAVGAVLRISPDDRPTAFRCATVSRAELEQLRKIDNVVRFGRVKRISETEIELDGGTVPTGPRVLHVDCTADAVKQLPVVPIFQGGLITLQSVRVCQPVFSAALIAHVEAAYPDEAEKNALCPVTPNPKTDADWLRFAISANAEQLRWAGNADIGAWMRTSRLHPDIAPPMPEDPAERAAFEQQGVAMARAQNAKLEELLHAHEAR